MYALSNKKLDVARMIYMNVWHHLSLLRHEMNITSHLWGVWRDGCRRDDK